MLQKTVEEFFSGEGAQPKLAGVGSPIAKSDLIILQLDQAAVADGDEEDIRSQVLEGGTTITHWLAMNNPILLLHFGGYVCPERRLLQGLPELAPEDHRGFVPCQSSSLGRARGFIRPVKCWGCFS